MADEINFNNPVLNNILFNGPLFIFGMARSGTTFLRRAVNSIPGIFLMYETTVIRTANDIIQEENVLKDRTTFQRFLDRLEDCELNMEKKPSVLFTRETEFYDQLYESFCNHRDFSEFCRELFSASVVQGGIWGNKLVDLDELQMLFTSFTNAKFIILIRDVRSAAYSNKEFFGTDYYASSLNWANMIRRIKSICEYTSDRVMMIHYEELVRNFPHSLERILSFIGRKLPDNCAPSDKAHTKSIEKWRNHIPPQKVREIEEICFNEMNQLGYDPEYAKEYREISRLKFFLSLITHLKGRITKRRSKLINMINFKSLVRYIKLYRN